MHIAKQLPGMLHIGRQIGGATWFRFEKETKVRRFRGHGAPDGRHGPRTAPIEHPEAAMPMGVKLPSPGLNMIFLRLRDRVIKERIRQRTTARRAIAQEQNSRRALLKKERFDRGNLAQDR
jgi:hypothetical protein